LGRRLKGRWETAKRKKRTVPKKKVQPKTREAIWSIAALPLDTKEQKSERGEKKVLGHL